MKKILAALLVSAGLAAPAHADFVITGGATSAGNNAANYTAIGNDFAAELIALGYTSFNQGGLVTVNSGGTISFTAYGSESANYNSFWIPVGVQRFAETDPAVKTFYNTTFLTATATQAQINNALSTMRFVVDVDNTGGSQNAGVGTSGFGIFFNPNDLSTIMLAFDDNGANPEDNHDDLLIRVAFVPEPATWAFMILGFAGLGLARRRRLARA